MIERLYERVCAGELLGASDVSTLLNADFALLTELGEKIKIHFKGTETKTCAIINARSGLCSEDCAFCAQSAHFETGAPVYPFIDIDKIRKASEDLAKKGVERFSIVMSGLGPDDAEFEKVKKAVAVIREYGLTADASIGCLRFDQLMELKEAGVDAYHHNLEVSRSFFPQICSTHDYEKDVQTVRDSVRAGMYVCSGGIFGLGESWAHRAELAFTLRELGVQSVPVNFLNPIVGTPMGKMAVLGEEEAMRVIAVYRFLLADRDIRVCGGRSIVFGKDSALKVLKSGANGIMVGDYLTVKGVSMDADMRALRELG
jgi:biotin synthase